MPTLPAEFASIILAFCPLFSGRVWKCAHVLLIGAILAPGKRTVTSALRVMGLGDEQHFQNYHRVLNRAAWDCRHASLILLRLLLDTFVPRGPLVLGLDDTIERRWGGKIQGRGIYRDPVRSSDSHFVKTSGLRWLSLMLLADSLGRTCVGFAVSDSAGAIRTLLATTEAQAQTPHRLGPPTAASGTAMVSYSRGGGLSLASLACAWMHACFGLQRRARKRPSAVPRALQRDCKQKKSWIKVTSISIARDPSASRTYRKGTHRRTEQARIHRP